MNHKQWIRQSLAHQDGPVPYNFLLSPKATEALQKHYACKDVEEAIGLPIRMSGAKSIKPLYASPDEFGPTIKDEFGVTWSTSHIDRGSPIGPSLREPDLGGIKWPDPAAAYRFEHLQAWCEANAQHFRILWVGDMWERATFMRGMEELLVDLATDEKFVRALLRRLADYILATVTIMLERFDFEGIAVSDDYGAQHGLLMSPAAWRRVVKPLLAEIYGLAKSRGKTVFHHTCGHVTEIIPDMIDAGLDILHPIQPETMDIYDLKARFGRDLTFCGGLNTQQLLPYGTPQQVRDEVRRLKDKMGARGGYILEPGITIQADVPPANMIAMIEEAQA